MMIHIVLRPKIIPTKCILWPLFNWQGMNMSLVGLCGVPLPKKFLASIFSKLKKNKKKKKKK
jgi:hypothetical protein